MRDTRRYLCITFPSPTGVTYYKYMKYEEAIKKAYESFRPLQGLPIINYKGQFVIIRVGYGQFPSPTGVTYYK